MPKILLGRVTGRDGMQGEPGIPGPQGRDGQQGVPGRDGITPSVKVGSVTTLSAGSAAAVRRREGSPDEAPVLDFSIPRGDKGDTGSFSSNCYFRVFEPWEWSETEDGAQLRISQAEHGAVPARDSCIYALRMRLGRNCLDYRTDGDGAEGRAAIFALVQAALAANTATPGSYPTAADGHVELTWAQVQYYLLDELLVPAAQAEQAAAAKGFDWSDRPVDGAEETVTLDQVLAAAYLPVMGTPAAAFEAMCTVEVLRGLRLRRRMDGLTGAVSWYDLDGRMTAGTWGVMTSAVHWDLDSMDLVIDAGEAYPGDIMVME